MLSAYKSHKNLIALVAVGDYSTVEKGLIEEHWDPNVRNKDDVTPAHKAAERNDLKMLKLLHSAGANLDVTDGFGTTPLFYTKENRNSSMIDFITSAISQTNIATSWKAPLG